MTEAGTSAAMLGYRGAGCARAGGRSMTWCWGCRMRPAQRAPDGQSGGRPGGTGGGAAHLGPPEDGGCGMAAAGDPRFPAGVDATRGARRWGHTGPARTLSGGAGRRRLDDGLLEGGSYDRLMKSFDVVVCGLGAMAARARTSSRRGVRVLGLDRFSPPHSLGSTTGTRGSRERRSVKDWRTSRWHGAHTSFGARSRRRRAPTC